MEWDPSPGQAVGTPQIFPRILCAFLRDSETPMFKAPNLLRKICGKSAQKSEETSAHRNLRKKSAQKSAHHNQRKNCIKNRCEDSVSLKDESQKKKNGKICAKFVQNPSPYFLSFSSFLGLSRFLRDFPDLLGDGPGIFPIRPFSLSLPLKSTYEEQSRKDPRHDLDLSRKNWETPGFGNPPI